MADAYQLVILSFLAFGFLFFIVPNLLYLNRKLPNISLPKDRPLVSVLIPARNEEKNISWALASLLRDPYPNFEVLVYDDDSADKTGTVVEDFAKKDARVGLLRGKTLPSGWGGKNQACFELAKKAKGEYLFFTDADTTFKPGILEFSLKKALTENADLISGIPHLWSPSFWGRLIMPNVYFIVMGFFPVPLSGFKALPQIAYALGSYLFFKKEAYWQIGGHETVKNILNEDVALAKKIKKAGLRFRFADPARFIASKMYGSFSEVWEGYGKNLFKALGSSYTVLTSFTLLYLVLYILPFFFVFYYPLTGEWGASFLVVVTQIILVLGFRFILSLRFQLSWESVALHPFSTLLMLAIGIRSGILPLTQKGYEWKGRNLK